MLTTGWMIIISLFAGITIPANVDKAKFGNVENVVSGPHYPSFLQSNIIVADSSVDEYCMWTQIQECLAYNQIVGGLEFVCDNWSNGSCFNVFQTDSNFSLNVTDAFVYSAQLGPGAYPTAVAGVKPYISFSYLISGQWGGMGAQYESGGWFSSYWDAPVDVGTGNLGTHKNIGKQLPTGNILFIAPDMSNNIHWSTYTPDLSTRLAGGIVVPATAYYWGFDINGGIAYLFYSDTLMNIYYKTTTDGITWNAEQAYNMVWPNPYTSNVIGWTQMAVTNAGNPILIFDNLNGDDYSTNTYPYRGKVYVSTASGANCIEVGDTTTDAKNFYPTIATGGNYVVALFGKARSGSDSTTFWDIYYNYSADGGATWSTPRNLTAGITDHNNCLWQIAKRVDSAGQFFFTFGCAISEPLLDLYWNINNGSPIASRWYVGRNPVVGIVEHKTQTPTKLALNVLPNPSFNRSVISYALPTGSNISLKLYSADGRLVRTIDQGYRPAGVYTVNLNAQGLTNGTYFVVLETNKGNFTRTLIVVH